MTVVEQARGDIAALIYRRTPRGQMPSSAALSTLLDRLADAARAEGALKPGEAPAVAVEPSAAQLRAELETAAATLERAARAIEVMGAGNVDAEVLVAVLRGDVAGYRKAAGL